MSEEIHPQLAHLSEEDKNYVMTEIKKAYPEMETHLEIFTLPSGKELHLWCDGRFDLIEKSTARVSQN